MLKEYTTKDTLNSISWQLKRIAEVLESIDQRQRSQDSMKQGFDPFQTTSHLIKLSKSKE